MLSKTPVYKNVVNNYTISSNAYQSAPYTTIDYRTMPVAWKIKMTFDIKSSNSNSVWIYLYEHNSGTSIKWGNMGDTWGYSSSTTPTNTSHTSLNSYPAWTRIDLRCQVYNSATTMTLSNLSLDIVGEGDTGNNYIVYPKEIKEIWEFTTWVFYWKDINWIFRGGIVIWDTTDVTTGSITLGNAKGYIKVNYNGEIVKIPYYWN